MLTLTLIRHAKSSWQFNQLEDFRRPLNTRGLRDCIKMPHVVADNISRPDIILSSNAVRAIQTCEAIADGWGLGGHQIILTHDIYMASTTDLLDLLGVQPNSYAHIALVGHNPGFTDLANHLGDSHISNIPTLGVVSMQANIREWSDVYQQHFETVSKLFPKEVTA